MEIDFGAPCFPVVVLSTPTVKHKTQTIEFEVQFRRSKRRMTTHIDCCEINSKDLLELHPGDELYLSEDGEVYCHIRRHNRFVRWLVLTFL